MDAHIVILNYNGVDILRRYLPSVVKTAEESSNNVKVTVLDNRSSDNSVSYLKENFSSVNVAVAEKNLIVASYNDFIKTIPEEVILLLNNDAYMAPGCIDRLIESLRDDSVFVVAPKVMDVDGKNVTGGCMDFSVKAGLFRNELKNTDKNNYTLFIGSTAAYNRKKFLSLGGYDPMYLPGTCEDLDLCYRAWQRGWLCVYEERAIAYHEESVSFNKVYGNKKRQAMSARNAYLFVWKNIHDAGILASNILLYPFLVIFNFLRMRPELAMGSLRALLLLPVALAGRRWSERSIVRTDKSIRELFQKNIKREL